MAMLSDNDGESQVIKDTNMGDAAQSSPPASFSVDGRISPASKPRLCDSDIPTSYDHQASEEVKSPWNNSVDGRHDRPTNQSDRVFPIRSVVSVDSTAPPTFSGYSGEMTDYFSGSSKDMSPITRQKIDYGKTTPRIPNQNSRASDSRKRDSTSTNQSDYRGGRMQQFIDTSSDRSEARNSSLDRRTTSVNSNYENLASEDEEIQGLVTARFQHIVTAEGHAVITGRDGETLQRCEDEPIHIPGAVQSFGLLIALSEHEENQFLVRVVSENSHRMIGYSPQELFKLDNFLDILSEEQQENLLDHIDFIRDDDLDPASNGPEVFIISIRPPGARRSRKLWVAMHINVTNPDLIICEFELDDDQVHPLVPPHNDTPVPPEDTLNSNPTIEEFNDSTINSSKPLRVLRNARKQKGEAAAMEVFNIMSQVQEQLAEAPDLDLFLKILVGVVKELTGFHRVMIYQFDGAFNGRVVTELVDPRATKDLYKGLNFPASDIPKQARDLYKVNKVRLLYDRDMETARLVCRGLEELENPLDLSYSFLRAMSPIHIKYLANMAVRSSMSISINAFGELWGLIACHTYGPHGMRVSFPIRKMCRLVGDTASRNIERLSYASRLHARKLINTVPTEANPSGYIIASSDELLGLFDADFGLLSIKGETKILGKCEQSHEALAILEYIRMRKITTVITSQDIKQDFPDLVYAPGFHAIAGLLLVPLSTSGSDIIVFFRAPQVKQVKWAGNPYEKFIKEGTEGYLEPRKSFKVWNETVIGQCREWSEEQVETAAVLCLVYGKFIEVWRQKEAAMQSSQLTRILLANSAHEVRTPLNAIINYLEIALEGALDQETRDNLAKSHSASKSLIYVINDLLDLTKTEEGLDLIKDEVFNLPETIREAADFFRGDIKRKGIEYTIIEHPGVPQLVHGDQRRVRQAIANLTANAVQNTTSGYIQVEFWLQDISDSNACVEIVVQDSGAGMSNSKLDSLFRDLEQVDTDHTSDNDPDGETSLPNGNRILGLGLAMVARVIRNMNGQLRLKSEEGKGSRFVIQLPFVLPDDNSKSIGGKDRSSFSNNHLLEQTPSITTPPAVDTEGEVTLIEKPSSIRPEGPSRRLSKEEVSSLHSFKTESSTRSEKSEVDRLIDAISAPMTEEGPDSLQRVNSSGSGQNRRGTASGSASISSHNSARLKRSGHYHSSTDMRSTADVPGSERVAGNKTPIRAVRMPDEFSEPAPELPAHSASKIKFNIPSQSPSQEAPAPQHQPLNTERLNVLVAEDDPVNSRIINKRLEKGGHIVYHTINGEECASAYGDNVTNVSKDPTSPSLSSRFDVVLMDMQMPIVDGLSSTKMIRSFEKTHLDLSPRASLNGRVPIFAVSASLVERERQTYIEAGFDGWILKPIDFKRLNVLLEGIVDEKIRQSCLYKPGEWERGGWFHRMPQSALQSSTKPSNETPVTNPPQHGPEPVQPDISSLDGNESVGSVTPMNESRHPSICDERLNDPKDKADPTPDSDVPSMEEKHVTDIFEVTEDGIPTDGKEQASDVGNIDQVDSSKMEEQTDEITKDAETNDSEVASAG